MEEDDPSDAAVDALVGREEQLAVATPVLFRVLNPDGVQTFCHAACRQRAHVDRRTSVNTDHYTQAETANKDVSI